MVKREELAEDELTLFAPFTENELNELSAKDKLMVKRFLISIKENKDVGKEVICFIFRQLNADTLDGFLTPEDYKECVMGALTGCYKLTYLSPHFHDDQYFVKRDALYESAFNLIVLLYSRVLGGRDYNLRVEEIRAKQPLYVSAGVGNIPVK